MLEQVPIVAAIPPGGENAPRKLDVFPGPGTYSVYAFIDQEGAIDELNEDNNEISIKVTVP